MLNKLFLLIGFLCCVHLCHAQLYPFTVFNTSNGLVNNRCGNISQDSAGYIWIGTDDGICNYDGRKFNFFPGPAGTYYFGQSQPNRYKGQCLLGANGSIAKCCGNNLKFIIPTAKNNGFNISILGINDSSYLVARSGYFDKLLLLEGTRETEIEVPVTISKSKTGFHILFQDIEKNIWVTSDNGVMLFEKGDFKKPYVIPVLADIYNNCIKEDFEHNVFISSGGAVYRIGREQLKNLRQASPVKFYQTNEAVTSLGFLQNGDILLGHNTEGVKIFSKTLQWKKDINGVNGLSYTVWDIFTDRENNTWFATENGLLRLRDFDFIYFPTPPSASTNVKTGSFCSDNSFIYSNGTNFVKLVGELEYPLPDDQHTPGFLFDRLLVTPDNELWTNYYTPGTTSNQSHSTYQFKIGTHNTFREKDVQQEYHLTTPVRLHQAITVFKKEMLFLTEDGKLYWYANKKAQPVNVDSNTMATEFSILVKGPQTDDILLFNYKKGIYHCKVVKQHSTISLSMVGLIALPEEVLQGCRKIYNTENGVLWIGTYNQGIFLYKNETGKGYRYQQQLTTPAISSVMVNAFLQDSTGNMWIGTNNGIDKIIMAGDSIQAITKSMFENKLSGRMIYFLKEKNNRLFIGTTGSLAIAKINSTYTKVSPLVYINHLGINNANADSLLAKKNNEFKTVQNNISFEFVALSFINEKQTAYQYKLDGADTAWSSPSANYTVTYARLKPGNYTFRVRAKNAADQWSDEDATFSFTIQTPFYQHWAFFLLCAGILSGIGYWLYRQKIAAVIAVERTRHHISKDLHDDIGSTLSSITLMNAVLKNKIDRNPDEAVQLAGKIEDTSREMIQNMSDIVWSINPGNDTMEKLRNRLQEFCANVFEDTSTIHKLAFSEALLKKTLSMQLRRDIYLICKEITNNAAKYSHAKNYTLSLTLQQSSISINAVDDGKGFDEALAKSGNGLNNIRQRVSAHKGSVDLTTLAGTKWNISIPVS